MNQEKQLYLNRIRNNTAYPVFRGIIGFIAGLGYVLAIICGSMAFLAGVSTMMDSLIGGVGILIGGLVAAVLIFLLARFLQEAALILADIGDSITDSK
ncbi:MAG: hypothetical protein QM627_03945 [Luteolibacter sp.]